MDYDFISLRTAGIIVGLLLIASHTLALLRPVEVKHFLGAVPRSRPVGMVLLLIAATWTFWLWSKTDLGEFYNLRRPGQIMIPVGFFLLFQFVDEFLASRALGILLLLAASPLLESAFLRPETSRLLLVVLAYVWIILGMTLVGSPHTLRDGIDAVRRNAARWRVAMCAGWAYGVTLLVCALALW